MNRETMIRECLSAARADLQDYPYSAPFVHKYLSDIEAQLTKLTDEELAEEHDAWVCTDVPTESWLARHPA